MNFIRRNNLLKIAQLMVKISHGTVCSNFIYTYQIALVKFRSANICPGKIGFDRSNGHNRKFIMSEVITDTL